jgi:nucleoid DNA-binding protein
MALRYILEPNEMNKDGSYYPRLVDRKLIKQDYLLELMSRRSGLNKQDLKLALELLEEVLMDRILEGDTVQTPLGNFSLFLGGSISAQDSRKPSHHKQAIQAKLNLQPTASIKSRIDQFSDYQQVSKRLPRPSVLDLKNLDRPEAKDFLPGELAALYGTGLSIDPQDQEAGAFFVNEDGREYPVHKLYPQNGRRVQLQMPPLPPGPYTLVYRSRMRTQDLRSCSQPLPCTIAQPSPITSELSTELSPDKQVATSDATADKDPC